MLENLATLLSHGDVAVKQVKQLLNEGASVMSELERVTRHLASSAKGKIGDVRDNDRTDLER